ncbi:MAG: 2-oxoacid:acceptor oxidoreductase family protein, partial [Emcibacteraceae bacterium]|nr:2-oxoacid:acceptor oxidoreductase family protein [Emcibacteraceae bacterium]
MSKERISIAISALGGQGGGVLSNWVVSLAEANGYRAQYTAIAGVAQRTGATIYAIELYPDANVTTQEPVLALMPVAGDVDICIASELMEAGRAVNRGIVTPDKTTLIASDHRVYAISEKENLGDGRVDSDGVRKAIKSAAKKLVLFDMEEMVLQSSSVISSVLFGALAGSGA